MTSKTIEISLPDDLNRRLEEYIRKHYRAYITGRGVRAQIITEALKEWLDKHEGS